MTGDDLVAFAGKLAANTHYGEPGYRSAVSRAYYGAFHIARSFMDELEFAVPANATGHEFVVRRLTASGHAVAAEAARILNNLRSERN